MDRRLTRSMPMLVPPLFISPVTYRAICPRWFERRHHRPRHFYVGGVRTQLIGADSYPNPCGAPRRLILCGPTGSYQKMTRSSSTAELSRTGVYCSVEDLRPKKGPRRPASCEDVCRGTITTTTNTSVWDSRLSESGVSLNDSRTDLGSYVGLEDVDRVSQSSFGSSSAFHEITCDSELDRHDSDYVSVPGSGYGHDRSREVIGQDRESRARRRERSGGGGPGKVRHDSGSREKFLSELTASSGRSSPTEDKEFYHSTPTKRGSPVLSIFPADEEDLHFPSNFPRDSFPDSLSQSSKDSLLYSPNLPKDSLPDFTQSTDSLPISPITEDGKKRQTSTESVTTTLDTVTEALKRRRREFFSSLQDCSKLEEQSAGDSVQSWLTTGHPQRHSAVTTPPPSPIDQDTSYLHHQPQQPHQRQPLSPPSPAVGGGISVRDRVRAIEQGPSSQTDGSENQPQPKGSRLQASGCSGENRPYGAATPSQPTLSLAERGGAEGLNSQQLYPIPAAEAETASLLRTVQGSPRTGDVPNVSSADGQNEGGFNTQFSTNDNRPTLSDSPCLNNKERDENYQHSEGRVFHEFGTVSGQSEKDRSYLRVINDGPETLATDQQLAANDGTVSDVDRHANTGANTTTDATQALLADNTLVSEGLNTTADVCRNEASFVSVEEGESDENTNIGDKNFDKTCAVTGETTSDGEKHYVAENHSDTLKAGHADNGQNAESVQLVSTSNGTDITSGISKKTQVEKEAGRQTDSAQDTTLYHARPIQIVPSEETENHFSQLNALHTLDPVTPSPHPGVSGDSSTHPSLQSSGSSPSLYSATPSPLDTVPSSGTLPDGDDAEVESVLAGVATQLGPASCEWKQGQLPAAPAMDQQYHQGLSTDHTDSRDGLTIREVSRRHTRHVHRTRTTVQETVTTRHTAARHSTGSPTSPLGEGDLVNGEEGSERLGSRDNVEAYNVTDKTVSRTTVTEEDTEREETTTKRITRQPLSQLDPDSKAQSSEDFYRTHPNHTPAECSVTDEFSPPTALTDTGEGKHLSAQQQKGRDTEDAHMMAGGGWRNSSYDILDNLQEQLSLLSSEGPRMEASAQSSLESRQLVGYTDYAEASLPHRDQTEADSIPHSSNIVRGSGSVVITLDTNGPQQMGQVTAATSYDLSGSSSTEWKTDRVYGDGPQDTTLYRARAIQIFPTDEEGKLLYGDGREDPAPSSRFTNSSLWAATASSPEVNDSDDHYTSISTTDSSHHHHHYPYSDTTREGLTEDGISGHSFHDFLSGQFSSDQPSLHRNVDIIADDFQPYLLHPSVVQETIVEADDERDSAEEDAPLSPTTHSFKTSLHFSVSECTPTEVMSISPVPQTKLQNTDQNGMNNPISEDRISTMSPTHPLQDLSDRLSSIGDVSYELHIVRSHDEPDHPPACVSPTPSDVSEGSVYSTAASAEVRKMVDQGALHTLTESTLTHKLTARRLSSTVRSPKKSQWVQESVLLFHKLLNDLEWQTKTSEQKLMEEMVAMDKGRRDGGTGEKQSELCDDLYRSFTREYLENRQNHVCPIIEDHLPVFRFKRFLRKKHNSKLKGHKTFRVRHQLGRLLETSQAKDSDIRSVSDVSLTQTRQSPYQLLHAHRILSPAKLRGRFVSEVFTDDADVNRSFSSDSAYSSLSSSRHVSDLDSTFRSVASSRADVSSIVTDVSMDSDKLRLLSDVFDQLDVCEGEIDTARLDRLRVGHSKAETL